ncbi:MAG: lysophospholipid acyltransferase family protein [Verrucomicrobiaceae bacterium]
MPKNSRPKLLNWLEYGVLIIVESGLRLLSVSTTYSIGQFLGRLGYRVLPYYRNLLMRNFRYAYGTEKSLEELRELTEETFEQNGANLISALRIPFCPDEQKLEHVVFKNKEILAEALAEDKGVIIVAPHMGNWELLAQTVNLIHHNAVVGTHYRPLNNPILDKLIKERRSKKGLHLFPKLSSTHKLASFIRDKGVLGIMSDQRVGERGEPTVYFGRPTTFSPLPAVLAKRTGAPMIGLHCRTIAPHLWEVTITRVTNPTPQACATSIEDAINRAPRDAFWFQDRWRVVGRRPFRFIEKDEAYGPIKQPLRLGIINFPGQAPQPLGYPARLATQEHLEIDPDSPDSLIAEQLAEAEKSQFIPFDAFVVPAAIQRRIRKITPFAAVFALENIAPSDPAS